MNATREGEVVAPAATGTQIVEFSRVDQALGLLRERLAGITYDFSKTGDLQRAIKDRAEVRGYRTDLERTRKVVKEEVLVRGRLIDGEAKRIEEKLRELEEPIDQQIKVEEERKERERQEREEKERARVADIQNRIAWFGITASSSAGMASKDIIEVIASVEALAVDSSYAEFSDQARGAKDRALTMLRQMHAGALALEQAAAAKEREAKEESERLERERAELDRRRAEQEARDREEKDRQARMAAEEAARRAKIEAEEREARERREAADREHRDRLAAEERAAREKREAQELADAKERAADEAQRRRIADELYATQQAEAKRLAEERAKVEAEARELEMAKQEMADARTILERFVARFGEKKEFAKIVTVINLYLKAAEK